MAINLKEILAMNKLDRYDLRILEELQRDARISNQELAERIGLSPSPCSRRVKQLEDDGYIVRQVALLDRKKLGLSLTAFVLIGMDRHTPERFEHFQEVIGKCPEVLEGVSSVRSSFVLNQVLASTELPLEHLRD